MGPAGAAFGRDEGHIDLREIPQKGGKICANRFELDSGVLLNTLWSRELGKARTVELV